MLQRFRTVPAEKGGIRIPTPKETTFTAEGVLLERPLERCFDDRDGALKELATEARRVDKAAFGNGNDFGQAHQALLKTIDRARQFIAV